MKLKKLIDIKDSEICDEVLKREELLRSGSLSMKDQWILFGELEVLRSRKLNSYYENTTNYSS